MAVTRAACKRHDASNDSVEDTFKPDIGHFSESHSEDTREINVENTRKPKVEDTTEPKVEDTTEPKVGAIREPHVDESVQPAINAVPVEESFKPDVGDFSDSDSEDPREPKIEDTTDPKVGAIRETHVDESILQAINAVPVEESFIESDPDDSTDLDGETRVTTEKNTAIIFSETTAITLKTFVLRKSKPLWPKIKRTTVSSSAFGKNTAIWSFQKVRIIEREFRLSYIRDTHVVEYFSANISALILVLLSVLVGLIAAFFFGILWLQKLSPAEKFNNYFAQFRSDFPTQSERTMLIANTSISWIFQEQSEQPSIIMLVSSANSATMLSSFAKHLAMLVEESFEHDPNSFAFVNIMEHRHQPSNFVRELINKTAYGNFSMDKRAFLIENVHEMPGDSPVVFMAFLCDNFIAPFKNVVYIMTVVSSLPTEQLDAKQTKVSSAWKGRVHDETLPAIESRIGSSIAVITE